MTNAQVARFTARSLLVLVILAALAFPADWLLWRARGSGMGHVEVNDLTAAQLKGNKEEFYVDGKQTVDCSRSLFRQAGAGACWYLQRHTDRVTTY